MEGLTEDLQAKFKLAETGWWPGLGLWIGETAQRMQHMENQADTLRRRLGELQTMEMKAALMEKKLEKQLADIKSRIDEIRDLLPKRKKKAEKDEEQVKAE